MSTRNAAEMRQIQWAWCEKISRGVWLRSESATPVYISWINGVGQWESGAGAPHSKAACRPRLFRAKRRGVRNAVPAFGCGMAFTFWVWAVVAGVETGIVIGPVNLKK